MFVIFSVCVWIFVFVFMFVILKRKIINLKFLCFWFYVCVCDFGSGMMGQGLDGASLGGVKKPIY